MKCQIEIVYIYCVKSTLSPWWQMTAVCTSLACCSIRLSFGSRSCNMSSYQAFLSFSWPLLRDMSKTESSWLSPGLLSCLGFSIADQVHVRDLSHLPGQEGSPSKCVQIATLAGSFASLVRVGCLEGLQNLSPHQSLYRQDLESGVGLQAGKSLSHCYFQLKSFSVQQALMILSISWKLKLVKP